MSYNLDEGKWLTMVLDKKWCWGTLMHSNNQEVLEVLKMKQNCEILNTIPIILFFFFNFILFLNFT